MRIGCSRDAGRAGRVPSSLLRSTNPADPIHDALTRASRNPLLAAGPDHCNGAIRIVPLAYRHSRAARPGDDPPVLGTQRTEFFAKPQPRNCVSRTGCTGIRHRQIRGVLSGRPSHRRAFPIGLSINGSRSCIPPVNRSQGGDIRRAGFKKSVVSVCSVGFPRACAVWEPRNR